MILSYIPGCGSAARPSPSAVNDPDQAADYIPRSVSGIFLPEGYKRSALPASAFGYYLQNLKLKKDKTVYLFNGAKKPNQQAQYAVLDMSVGARDLQQCADALMRLRAEYLFSEKQFGQIRFPAGDGTLISYNDWLKGWRYKLSGNKLIRVPGKPVPCTRESLLKYLETVFTYCGTSTLPASLYKKPIMEMQPGDVLLKPGAPGHAVIVMRMAENENGEKIYLLAQSYMPAQDIHLLKNPAGSRSTPWYVLGNDQHIQTPEWTFYTDQLYGWK
ncbi:DUF4846 domain-containing protein [Niabella aurantiaca]|uniref:DUF4846 domain-containing protein n=1 Tax=Niabella aurantiaca TaxID=379900 RepID=UPI00146B4BE9|nr:DUF4846 domain-containing protein [Niabella aurantiaca]